MYLSKVKVASKTGNPYDWHRILWTLFTDRQPENREFLFRIEKEWRSSGVDILLQSNCQPGDGNADVQILASRDYRPRLQQDQILRFRLVGNPIKTIKDERGRKNSKGEIKACRVPLVQEDQQLAWLSRKLDGAALIESAIVSSRRPIYFRKVGKAGKILAVTFDGVLRVSDSKKFLIILQNGIGPAKGFGCGLLSIARG